MLARRFIKLIISVSVPLAVGAIAGAFTAPAIPEWYGSLNRPLFAPPNWVFAPVWTTLYIIMGISFYLVWSLISSRERNTAIAIFCIQLILNFAWSFLFFYFKSIGLALAEIVLLSATIVIMITQFYKLKPVAAYLNIPYLLWVSFATMLNAAYFILN